MKKQNTSNPVSVENLARLMVGNATIKLKKTMNEKDLKRLKELEKKDGTGEMTSGEQEEYDVLLERKQLSDIVKSGIKEVKDELTAVKSKVDAITVDKNEDVEKNPSLRIHGLVNALYHKDSEAIKKLQGVQRVKT